MSLEFDRHKSDKIAQDLLGMEFALGGRGKDKKIDCYGVLSHYYREFGLSLPDYNSSEDWGENEDTILSEYANFFTRLKLNSTDELRVGDMILFIGHGATSMGHLGVYLGDGKFIHSYKKIGVKIDSLTNKIWKENAIKFFRVKDRELVRD